MRMLEKLIFPFVLFIAAGVIMVLMLATWCVQLFVNIANDPLAGPYRQVR